MYEYAYTYICIQPTIAKGEGGLHHIDILTLNQIYL